MSQYSENDLPAPGSLFFVPLEGGRFSIARVAKRKTAENPTESTASKKVISAMVLVISSSWVGVEAKRPSDEDIRNILNLNHHSWKNKPQMTWICEPPPDNFPFAGNLHITEEDEALDSGAYGGWESLCIQPLLQWRWDHDREQLLLEEEINRQKIKEKALAFMERQSEILRTTTLESLLERKWFENWDAEHETIARNESQCLITAFVHALHLAPKTTKAVVRRHLRACVQAFNQLDTEKSFIQTTHAEDIFAALELIVSVVRHPDLANLIDEWREW